MAVGEGFYGNSTLPDGTVGEGFYGNGTLPDGTVGEGFYGYRVRQGQLVWVLGYYVRQGQLVGGFMGTI
jgi:hypothetical protein